MDPESAAQEVLQLRQKLHEEQKAQARLRVRVRKQAGDLQKNRLILFAYEATFFQKSSKAKPSDMSSTHIVSFLRNRVLQLEKEQAELTSQPAGAQGKTACEEPMTAPRFSPTQRGGKPVIPQPGEMILSQARLKFAEDTICAHMSSLLPNDYDMQSYSKQRSATLPAIRFVKEHIRRVQHNLFHTINPSPRAATINRAASFPQEPPTTLDPLSAQLRSPFQPSQAAPPTGLEQQSPKAHRRHRSAHHRSRSPKLRSLHKRPASSRSRCQPNIPKSSRCPPSPGATHQMESAPPVPSGPGAESTSHSPSLDTSDAGAMCAHQNPLRKVKSASRAKTKHPNSAASLKSATRKPRKSSSARAAHRAGSGDLHQSQLLPSDSQLLQGDALIPGYHGAELAYVAMPSCDTPREDDDVLGVDVPLVGPEAHGDNARSRLNASMRASLKGKRDVFSQQTPPTKPEGLQLNTFGQHSIIGEVADAQAGQDGPTKQEEGIDPVLVHAKKLLEMTIGGIVTINAATRSLVVELPVGMQHIPADIGIQKMPVHAQQDQQPESASLQGSASTGGGLVHPELPALLTSSDGSVHTLTGSLEDLFYEAAPVMHQGRKSLPASETQQPISGPTSTYGSQHATPHGAVDTSTIETNQLRQPARAFPLVEEISSASSACGSPEKEEFHDPMHDVASSPHSNKGLQEHASHTGAQTGVHGDSELFTTSSGLHSARTSSTSFFSPCRTVPDQCGGELASPKVLKAFSGCEMDTTKDQGATQSLTSSTHCTLRSSADEREDQVIAEERVPQNSDLSRSEVSGSTQTASLAGQIKQCQPQREKSHEPQLSSAAANDQGATGELHSGHGHSTCSNTTGARQSPAAQCSSGASMAEETAPVVVPSTEPATSAVEVVTMSVETHAHQDVQVGCNPTRVATAQQDSSVVGSAAAVDTPEHATIGQQGSCSMPAAHSEGKAAANTGAITDSDQWASRTATHNNSGLQSPKTAGSPSRGASTSRPAAQHAPEAAMLGPFGCSMGFVQLAVPWAPQRRAAHGVPLAAAAPAALQLLQQQPQLDESRDGHRHQQLLHQLLQQERAQQLGQEASQHQTKQACVQQQPQKSQKLPSHQSGQPPSQPQAQSEKRRGKHKKAASQDRGGTDRGDERCMQNTGDACDSTSDAGALPPSEPAACKALSNTATNKPAAHSSAQASESKDPDVSKGPNTSDCPSNPSSATQCSNKGTITMFQWPEANPDDTVDTPRNINFDFKPLERADPMAAPAGAPPTRRTRTRLRVSPNSSPQPSSWPLGKGAHPEQVSTGPSTTTGMQEQEQQHTFTLQGKCTSLEEMLKTIPAQIMDKIGVPEDIRGELEKAVGEGLPEWEAACTALLRKAPLGPQQTTPGRKGVKVRRRVEKGASTATVADQLAELAAFVSQADPPIVAAEQSAEGPTK